MKYKFLLLILCWFIFSANQEHDQSHESIYGTYIAKLYFPLDSYSNEKIILKSNNEYTHTSKSFHHGEKSKSVEYGKWIKNGNLIIFTPQKNKRSNIIDCKKKQSQNSLYKLDTLIYKDSKIGRDCNGILCEEFVRQ